MTNLLFYRDQAALQRQAADEATLENVRQRSTRAAEAWEKLAAQIDRANALRGDAAEPDVAPRAGLAAMS